MRTIDKPGTANDATDTYEYDSSDRLQSESRYANLTGTGTLVQTTTYGWTGTQQTSKVVSIPSTSTVTQTMSYGVGEKRPGDTHRLARQYGNGGR